MSPIFTKLVCRSPRREADTRASQAMDNDFSRLIHNAGAVKKKAKDSVSTVDEFQDLLRGLAAAEATYARSLTAIGLRAVGVRERGTLKEGMASFQGYLQNQGEQHRAFSENILKDVHHDGIDMLTRIRAQVRV